MRHAKEAEGEKHDGETTLTSKDGNICNELGGEPDVKVIILGDSAVGKSKLVERYLIDDYNPRRLSTHALTLYRKNINIGDDGGESTVTVDFWDTAGQETFNSMHASYYYKAHVCIMVFDVTRKQTYLNLKHWYTELRQH